MRVAIVSSDYGHYDEPRPPTIQDTDYDVEYVMVTDDRSGWDGWKVWEEKRPHLHPNVAAKHAKFLPWDYTDANMTVWVDAGAWFGPGLVDAAFDALDFPRRRWAMFPHPHRTSIIAEVAVSRTLRKYDALPLEQQVDHYLDQGYPNKELWATGCIARIDTSDNQEFGVWWLAEVNRWGFQDQLSFAYLAWHNYLDIVPLGPSLFTSPHIRFADHTAKP